jgi:hypothetical protein
MLEHPSLLLQSWDARDDQRAWIIDAHSSASLGFARPRRQAGLLAWLCLRRRCYLAIHESEDEPLLLTIWPRLGPWTTWLVRDADARLVGHIRGKRLSDGVRQPLALLQTDSQAGRGLYLGVNREELAVTTREEAGVRLTFLAGERSSPFVKMVLLAAALVHNQDALTGSPCSPASPSLPTSTS